MEESLFGDAQEIVTEEAARCMSAVWTGKLEANMLARGDTAGTIIAHHVELQIISEQKWNDLVGAAKAGRPGRSEYRNLPVRQGVADAVKRHA